MASYGPVALFHMVGATPEAEHMHDIAESSLQADVNQMGSRPLSERVLRFSIDCVWQIRLQSRRLVLESDSNRYRNTN
jgi:hypothetical protein